MRGADKLLEDAGGGPVLRLLAERGLAAGLQVRVSVPDLTHARALVLRDLELVCLPVPDAAQGMSASLRAALAGLQAPNALILPGDMPEITADDLTRIAQAPGLIVQATAKDGTPGHPVRFDQSFFPELAQLRGDVGARSVLRRHSSRITRLALPGAHATLDLDTPEAWTAWRTRQSAGAE